MKQFTFLQEGSNRILSKVQNSRYFIIFAHNYYKKQNTNQASHCFYFYLSIGLLVKGLGTGNQSQSILTLIVQTIVCVV